MSDPPDPEEVAVRGCLMLVVGAIISLAWAFGSAWHFWGPR